jgi:hypothetical protein
MKDRIRWIALVIAVFLGVILYLIPGDHTTKLVLAAGYAGLVLTFFSGMIVLIMMATGSIDLSQLLEDDTGGASMSRFQLLIFTFVIALSFLAIVAKSGAFPQVPADVLALLGISATTYGVSKGISVSSGSGGTTTPPVAPPAPPPKAPTP